MAHAFCLRLALAALVLLTGPGHAAPPAKADPAGQAPPAQQANPAQAVAPAQQEGQGDPSRRAGQGGAADASAGQGPPGAGTSDGHSQSGHEQVGDSDAESVRARWRIALARTHFDAALEHYRRGEYRQAAIELDRALRQDPQGKDLVYNLGLVHEKLGEIDQSIAQFRRLLRMETDPRERDRIQRMIRRLEGARTLDRREADADEPPEERRGPSPSRPRQPSGSQPRRRFDGWVVGAGAVALTAAASAAALGVAALVTHPGSAPATDDESSVREHRAHKDDARGLAIAAGVSLGVSAVAGTAAALLYFSRTPTPSSVDGRCAAASRPRGTALTVSLRF